MNKRYTITMLAAPLLASALPALAHPQAAAAALGPAAGGLLAGFAHPFSGVDHLLAMLAVGIWSARQPDGRLLPLMFLVVMAGGAAAGAAGLAIAGLETGIAATVALAGCLVALAARVPRAAGMALVAAFALLHGNAHGHELPQLASAAGFLAASAVLLCAGRWFGMVARALAVRAAGAGIAAGGLLLMTLA